MHLYNNRNPYIVPVLAVQNIMRDAIPTFLSESVPIDQRQYLLEFLHNYPTTEYVLILTASMQNTTHQKVLKFEDYLISVSELTNPHILAKEILEILGILTMGIRYLNKSLSEDNT